MSEHEENLGQEQVTQEQVTETQETPANETATQQETPAPGSEAQQEQTNQEAATEPELGADGKPVQPAFTPQTKFKAGVFNKETRDFEQKEYEIDKRFHALMKDPESEKLVRELHTKAYGLDGVKARLDDTRVQLAEVSKENSYIARSVQDLKGIYQGAVRTGDWLKLDGFFQKLAIPEEHILNYALEKVKLHDLAQSNPTAYNALMSRRNAETENERFAQERSNMQAQMAQQAYENKMIQLDVALTGADVAKVASDYDQQVGREGAFKEMVKREGEYAFMQSQGRVDLTPQQAIDRAIANLGVKRAAPTPGSQAPAASQGQPATLNGKPVIQRTQATIPNISGTGASPLKPKVRSIEDIKKYREQHHGNG